jgi:hypothetical protein
MKRQLKRIALSAVTSIAVSLLYCVILGELWHLLVSRILGQCHDIIGSVTSLGNISLDTVECGAMESGVVIFGLALFGGLFFVVLAALRAVDVWFTDSQVAKDEATTAIDRARLGR